jgi:hypothetical protein
MDWSTSDVTIEQIAEQIAEVVLAAKHPNESP